LDVLELRGQLSELLGYKEPTGTTQGGCVFIDVSPENENLEMVLIRVGMDSILEGYLKKRKKLGYNGVINLSNMEEKEMLRRSVEDFFIDVSDALIHPELANVVLERKNAFLDAVNKLAV